MNISLNWIKNYVETAGISDQEIADILTLTGLEVEEMEVTGTDFENFVVGEVLEVRAHPNADKLQVCRVDQGDGETVQIVCGAPNVAEGQKVPVAKVGAEIPVPMKDGTLLKIKKMKLRGEESRGMICSESELGLSKDHSGIMVLDESLQPGTPLREVLGSTKDTILEIGLTPNRPDAACHIGVARDLSAVIGQPLKNPYTEIEISDKPLQDSVTVEILSPEKCNRYAALVIDNITIGDSPVWLQSRLKAIGLRPVNNVVDVTNFILHETGQPLHAFDYDLIAGNKIIVREFQEEVSFTTLDHIERKVPAGSLFICDGDGPVAIAGIMGGKNSEVTGETTKVLLESAWFDPASIRKTSKSIALQTDSSYRFERGIDPEMQLRAAYRAARMIAELSGGTIAEGHIDEHPVKQQARSAKLRISRLNRILGTSITMEKASEILEALEFKTTREGDDLLICTIPTFRPDVSREIDLIEEVGRIYDYNKIPRPTTARLMTPEPISQSELFISRLRSAVKALRYKEISTNSLLSGKEANALGEPDHQISTLNPVSSENVVLRTSLLAGFLKAISYNLNRNEHHLRFFEIGHTFKKGEKGTWIPGVDERIFLLIGMSGNREKPLWQGEPEPYTLFDLKADLESLFSTLGISHRLSRRAGENQQLSYLIGDKEIATLQECPKALKSIFDVEQAVYSVEVDLTALLELNAVHASSSYLPVPKYPGFEFDAAFTVDRAVRAGDLRTDILDSSGIPLKSVTVFDLYEDQKLGENKKSVAFRLTFMDSNKTLTIKDVEPEVKKIVTTLEKKYGAKLRS